MIRDSPAGILREKGGMCTHIYIHILRVIHTYAYRVPANSRMRRVTFRSYSGRRLIEVNVRGWVCGHLAPPLFLSPCPRNKRVGSSDTSYSGRAHGRGLPRGVVKAQHPDKKKKKEQTKKRGWYIHGSDARAPENAPVVSKPRCRASYFSEARVFFSSFFSSWSQ